MSNQEKPNKVYPSNPMSTPSSMPFQIPDPSIRGESWDQLIRNRGIRFFHKKATPCPNMNTVYDNSHNPNCPICDGQGIYYYEVREIYGYFSSNSLEKNFEMQGIWEVGTAMVTLPTQYENGDQAEFATFDQLVIPDFTVRLYELKEYEPRPSGQQMLRYPIHNVEYIASAVNDQINPFTLDVNYTIVDGNLQWIPGMTPSYDQVKKRGDVYVIQYFANPVYNVLQHMRELRISQQMIAGSKVAVRLPQQILVKRDFLANPAEKEASTDS